MRPSLLFAITGALVCGLSVGCQRPDERSVGGGTYAGYANRYDEKPVVQQHVLLGSSYEATFLAYDLGGEAHIIVYAQRMETGEYGTGMVRVAIQDPNGNALTIYRNSAAETVDEPIIWKPRSRGIHTVRVEFTFQDGTKATASFEVPLMRQPAPVVLLASVGIGIVLAVGAVGYILRKRQRQTMAG